MSYWQSSASSEDHHGCDQDHQPCPHFIIRWAPGRGAGSLTSGTIHTFNCFSFKHDHHCLDLDWRVELQTNVCEHFTIMEKVPTLLAIALLHLRHYAKWAPKHGMYMWNLDAGAKILALATLFHVYVYLPWVIVKSSRTFVWSSIGETSDHHLLQLKLESEWTLSCSEPELDKWSNN